MVGCRVAWFGGLLRLSEAGGPRLGAHRPWWLSVRQGVGVLEMESGQAQNMVISKKRVNLAVAWRSALATRAVQTSPSPSEERKTTCDMDVRPCSCDLTACSCFIKK